MLGIILKIIFFIGYFMLMYRLLSKRNGLKICVYMTAIVCVSILAAVVLVRI